MPVLPSLNVRAREPEAARDLIAKDRHVLGFLLSLAWVLSLPLTVALALIALVFVNR